MANTNRRNKPATQTTTNELIVYTVQDFCKEKGFIEIAPVIRENTNGYPFITFIDKSNVAENIYFSIDESDNHAEGELIEKGFFDELIIAETTNKDGETRFKISGRGNSKRVSLADLF